MKSYVLHEGGLSDFDIYEDGFITVRQDKLIYYNAESCKVIQETQLDNPAYSICVNPNNSRVFTTGGRQIDNFSEISMTTSQYIMYVGEKILDIKYSKNGNFLGIAAEEDTLNIWRSSNQRVSKCRPGHEGFVIGSQFDSLERYVASVGCDGYINLYQLSETPHLLKKLQISKYCSPDGPQRLKMAWHPSGEYLCLPGKPNLQYIMTEDDPQDLEICFQVNHDTDICIVEWLNEYLILTCSLDGFVKIWHFKSFVDISIYQKYQIGASPLQVRLQDKNIYILDIKGRVTQLQWEEIIERNKEKALMDLVNKRVKKQQQQSPMHSNHEEKEDSIQIQQEIHQPELKESEIMQDMIRAGEIQEQSDQRRYMSFNHVGTIVQCPKTEILEFEFFDTNFYKKFKLQNPKHFTIGTMNYKGCVLASRGPNDINKYGYQEGSGISTLFYYQFGGDSDSLEIEMPNDEGIDLVAIGGEWFAALTDQGTIKVFGFDGMEYATLQINRPFVAMTGYEQFLLIVYHDSEPLFENQILKMKIYDVDRLKFTHQADVALSLHKKLNWIGFSEEGMVMSQDSAGCVRVYIFEEERWQEVLNEKKLWVYGMSDYQIQAIKQEEDQQITPNQKLTFLSVKMEVYKLSSQAELFELDSKIAERKIIFQHEVYRWKYFGHHYHARQGVEDVLARYTRNMLSEDQLFSLQEEIRLFKIELFTELMKISIERGIEYFKNSLTNDIEMVMAIKLLESKQGQNKEIQTVVQKLKILQRQRMIRINYLKEPTLVLTQRPISPKNKGFGLAKTIQYSEPPQQEVQQKKQKQQIQPISHQSIKKDTQNEDINNPFQNSGQKEFQSIFDIKKRADYGSQSINNKKKL